MPSRRITRTLGVAAGGLLGVAFLPVAAAFADDYTVDSTGQETVTGIYGFGFDGGDTAPPAVAGSVQGDSAFTYTDTTTSAAGGFDGFESTSTDGFGDTNVEVYVASDSAGADAPGVGSVFDTYTFDGGLFSNVYSDVVTSNGDVITDTLESPVYGNFAIPSTFDAASADDPADAADYGGVPDGIGTDKIDPLGTEDVNAISGIPPLTAALQGTQDFGVDNSGGTQIGTFSAVDTTTTDGFGTYTEAALATSASTDGSVGAGSIFNTMDFLGLDSVYSDVVSTTGGANTITETIKTALGNFSIPTDFDATDAETTSSIDVPDGVDLTPQGSLDITGINGLAPVDVGVQGEQVFDYTDGSSSGFFDADVTNTLDEFGDTSETVLVTSSTDPDAPAGSTFETVGFGYGFENIYTDIVSTTGGADAISDTFVTPFGDFTLPETFNASAGLVADAFQILGSI